MEITIVELKALKIAPRYHWWVRSRLAVFAYVAEHGVKGASRRFGLDRKAIREWRRRWQAAGVVGLVPRYPADAICDRLLHTAYKIELNGESIRKATPSHP